MAVNLHLDQDAFQVACSGLEEKCRNLEALSGQIQSSFEQLRQDWDSQAGKLFFERFENDLIKNLDQFTVVMEELFSLRKKLLRESDCLRGRKRKVCTGLTPPLFRPSKALKIMGIQGESLPDAS